MTCLTGLQPMAQAYQPVSRTPEPILRIAPESPPVPTEPNLDQVMPGSAWLRSSPHPSSGCGETCRVGADVGRRGAVRGGDELGRAQEPDAVCGLDSHRRR